ncbi:hypothetical protein CsSME_00009180 [Camellia sinensis var. sinensis]
MTEKKTLSDLQQDCGIEFPGYDYHPPDQKNWMSGLDLENVQLNKLEIGTRVFDIRVQEDRHVCHGILLTYSVYVVINDIKKFLTETQSEIIILEIRTEFGHEDPPEFDKYLEDQLGEFLIHQDDQVFENTIAELLPKRIVCVWKPRNLPQPEAGGHCGMEVTERIHGYARLFIARCFARGCAEQLQIFSTDFIDEDFVDACVGVTQARIEGKA